MVKSLALWALYFAIAIAVVPAIFLFCFIGPYMVQMLWCQFTGHC